MSAVFEQLLSGLSTGLIYGGFAVAFVVMYQSTRVLNFALGSFATLAVYLALELQKLGLPLWMSMLPLIGLSYGMGFTSQVLVHKVIQQRQELSAVMATLGLSLIFESLFGYLFGYEVKAFPSLFGEHATQAILFGVNAHDLGTGVCLLLAFAGIYFLLHKSHLGLRLRGAVDNPLSLKLLGFNPQLYSAHAWGLAGALASFSGLLVAHKVFVSPPMFNSVVIYAFCGAILGGLQNPWGALGGGLILGVFENLVGSFVPGIEASLKMTTSLALMFVVLLIKPEGLWGRKESKRVDGDVFGGGFVLRLQGLESNITYWQNPWRKRILLFVAGLSFAGAGLFYFESYSLYQICLMLITWITLMGLTALLGHLGSLSLGHGFFVGVGAYTFSLLTTYGSWPWPWALTAALASSGLVGFLLSFPLVKLRGPSLAAATLGLGVAIPQIAQRFDQWTGGSMGLSFDRPLFFGESEFWNEDRCLFLIVAPLAVFCFWVLHRILLSDRPRLWVSIRDSESVAQAFGVPSESYRRQVFTLSACFAGVAGALLSLATGHVSPETFHLNFSFLLVAGLVVGGLGLIPGAFLGAVFLQFIPGWTEEIHKSLTGSLFGLSILVCLIFFPRGLASFGSHLKNFSRGEKGPLA